MLCNIGWGQLTVSFTSNEVCKGGITLLTSTATTGTGTITNFNWDLNGNGSYNNAIGQSINFQFSTADTFSVGLQVITDQGDTGTTSRSVVVRAQPNAGFQATAVCVGNSTVFINTSTISNGVISSYTWNFGDGITGTGTFPSHQYSAAQTFTASMVATADNGCTDSISGTATIRSLPTVSIVLNGTGELCSTDSTILVASTNASNYFWSTGASGDTLTVKASGWYYLTGSDQFACVNKDSIQIDTLFDPTITEIADTFVIRGNSIQLFASGANSYSWSPSASLNDPTSATPTATPTESTVYSVVGTTSSGCTANRAVSVLVKDDYWIDYTNVITPNGDGVNDVFRIRNIDMFNMCKFRIYNRWGDLMFSRSNYLNDWAGTWDGHPLPADTYYFTIDCADVEGNDFNGAITILK